MNKYAHFLLMIAVSTAIMFGLMYLNVYEGDHVFFSQTRLFMALIMGSGMSVVMLLFMRHMYTDARMNAVVIVGSVLLFAVALWLVRSQRTVDDVAYMKAMIPHHSIAVLTSKRAQIRDPRVRELADNIIKTQLKEIDEMKSLISDLSDEKK
jgi:hypothetical protein